MTKEIVESDIELAKALVANRQSDREILVILTRRGLEPASAARLILDVKVGRAVPSPMPLAAGPEVQRDEPATDDDMQVGREPSHRAEDRPHHGRARINWLVTACAGCAGLLLGLVISPYLRQGAMDSPLPVSAHGTGSSTKTPGPTPQSEVDDLRGVRCNLQMGTRGLSVGDTLLTQANALAALTRLLGPPSRTHQIPETKQVVHAFDNAGVLVYAQADGGDASLVVDFQGRGGEHGARIPFTGRLKIGEATVLANTDAKALAAIANLELKDAGTDGGLFAAKYHDQELFFAYRTALDQLSLVQINLK